MSEEMKNCVEGISFLCLSDDVPQVEEIKASLHKAQEMIEGFKETRADLFEKWEGTFH